MKKLTASIIGLILCTSPVLASAKTAPLSKDEIINQIKTQLEGKFDKLSLEELLNKFGGCIELPGNNQTPDTQLPENNTPSLPEEEIPENNIPEDDSFEMRVLELVNQERASRGLSPLNYSYELEKVAKAHSSDMAERNYFSHNTPEGKTPFDRLRNAGISYNSAGENIAAGQKSPEEVVNGWMNSSGHRANILNSNYTKMGIGCIYGGSYGIYWTQLFTG